VPFVNSYDFKEASRFLKTIPLPTVGPVQLPARYLAIGLQGNSGLAALIGADGNVQWSRQYSLSGHKLAFHDGVLAGTGADRGFVLLSSLDLPTAGRRAYVVVRIDASGNLTWARQIHTDRTRFAERVLRAPPSPNAPLIEEFLLTGWANDTPTSNQDAVELIRLRADGTVVRAVNLKLGTDDEIQDAIPFGTGYALIGDSAHAPGLAGFFITIDPTLNVLGSWLLTGTGQALMLTPRAMLAQPNRLVLTGRSSTDNVVQSSMIAEIRFATKPGAAPVPTIGIANSFSFTDGQDLPTRIAAIGNDILVFNRPDAFVRPQTVLRVNTDLFAQTHYGFDFPGGAELQSLEVSGSDTVLIPGADKSRPPLDQALLLTTGPSLDCCKTKLLATPVLTRLALKLDAVKATVTDVKAANDPAAVVVAANAATIRPLCGVIETQAEQMVQSPFLALQSAGSAGKDATRGILLRWFLLGKLGTSHLPKGTLAQTTVNFNKPDDFVTIYRAPWPGSAVPARQLSFATDKPTYVDDANSLLVFETGKGTPRDRFVVRFLNAAAYASARTAANPAQNTAGFLTAYGASPIEVELRDHLAVACDLDIKAGTPSYTVQVETFSVGENRPLANKILTSRRILGPADGTTPRLIAENLRSVRLACTGAQINSVALRCYEDVLATVNQAKQWTAIGRFALTLDQATAYLRLEDPAHGPVHGLWWKFNDGAFVNVNNYRSRWNSPNDGIAAAVQQYVALSNQDPQAIASVPSAAASDPGTISVSYLDLLQLAALDYHAARMLGLGHIDSAANDDKATYIHVAEYITNGDPGDGGGARPVQHLSMSPPTSLAQSRLPLVPDLNAVEYGLSVPTANGTPYALTDPMGYTPDGVARYIRLYPDCKHLYDASVSLNFFASPEVFDLAERTLPTLYGVEYRKAGETAWRKPEIGQDDVYVDTETTPVAESMPTPFPPKPRESAFIHKETEAGIHEYAAYGVNIFSRASTLSAVRATDATQFRKPNRLLPPSDLKAQLIQQESPLVLTTQSEQAELTGLLQSHADPTLVRLTCNYAHLQEMAYGFADTIEILFRPTPPSNVVGGVKTVGPTNDPSVIRIETEPYIYLSTLETIQPVLPPAQKANFVGGVLVAGNRRYTITDISWPNPTTTTGENPAFLVAKTTSPGVTATSAGHALVIGDDVPAIAPGDLIMAIENMAAASWGPGNPLAATIRIGDASWQTRTESFTRSDGTQVNRKLRGVWGTAKIDPPAAGTGKQYTITFDNYVLNAHPQASAADPVTWYKGIIRVPVAGQPTDDRRPLTVVGFLPPSGGNLTLIAADDIGEPGTIVTGPGQLVNYYPGYKLYLHAEPAHGFTAAAMLPAAGEGSRTTLVGARAVDTSTLDDLHVPYHSLVGVPQPLTAIEIIAPQTPQKPAGLKYATPPDAYNKSTYTLTVTFASGHKPFAAAFYRADAFSILQAIYKPQTFDAVRAIILPPDKDPFFANRFDDLFAFLSPGNAAPALQSFAMPNGSNYALPSPDADALGLTATMSLADRKAAINAAVFRAFLPLTRQPLIYDLIRADPAYVPTNKPQTFRDQNGDLLAPGVPPFDLAPMAKRSDAGGTHTIQFIDFTLDGSMNPNTVYFYFVREIGNRMQIGEPSPVFGPVKLVNLSPPSAPRLRKLVTVPYDTSTNRNPQVSFEVIAPSSIDPVSKISIYRAESALDALSLRTMTKVREIDLATLVPTADGTLLVADDFSSDPIVPYGEPLFYRLAWVREVAYEDISGTAKIAAAVSEPTRTLLANLIDVVNPTAPVPTLELLSTTAAGDKLLRLNWTKTVHNGIYYVSRLAPSGNWVRLGSLKTNDAQVTFDLPDALPIADNEGNTIYYRFKTDVENSSGLLNLVAAPITVSLDSI
jgi:hypothetical protein